MIPRKLKQCPLCSAHKPSHSFDRSLYCAECRKERAPTRVRHHPARPCQCCGEMKGTAAYSWNTKTKTYSPNCRECGLWLTLFRQVFGKPRDVLRNRERMREYSRVQHIVNRPTNIAGVNLWNAWRPQKDAS